MRHLALTNEQLARLSELLDASLSLPPVQRRAWLDSLVTGHPTVHTTPEQARVNLETTLAIERAVATGKAVRLPLEN